MVRRTKQQALATRDSILDAAERLFHERGVSRVSLADIADAAGVTRGAIYWHFENKAALFEALISRVTLPIEKTVPKRPSAPSDDPIADVRASVRAALRMAAHDPQAQAMTDIVSHKVEHGGAMNAARDRQLYGMQNCLAHIERTVKHAVRHGQLPAGTRARTAAVGLHALVDGMIQNWLLAPGDFDLEREGARAVDVFLKGLGARLP